MQFNSYAAVSMETVCAKRFIKWVGALGVRGIFMEQLALSNMGFVLSINVELLCTFPWETVTSKMTITACLLIDWLTQIELSKIGK